MSSRGEMSSDSTKAVDLGGGDGGAAEGRDTVGASAAHSPGGDGGADEPVLEGLELQSAVKTQVEYYFSKDNLSSDAFLLAQMDPQMYVPVSVIGSFSRVARLTKDQSVLEAAIASSDKMTLDAARGMVKPNLKAQRNTIILRDIPSSTSPDVVTAIFDAEGCTKPTEVRSDIGDTWFVTMPDEDSAMDTVLALRNCKFDGKPVHARLKSENILRTLIELAGVDAVGAARASGGAVAGSSGTGSPGGSPGRAPAVPGGYYTPGQGYVPSGGAPSTGAPNSWYGTPQAGMPWYGGYGAGYAAGGADAQGAMAAAPYGPGYAGGLPYGAAGPRAPGYPGEYVKYSKELLVSIVRGMPVSSLSRPEGMSVSEHGLVVTEKPNTALVARQRTVSIDAAVKHGRPVRTMSVDTVDYETMIYGDAVARERARSRAESMGSIGEAGPSVPPHDGTPASASSKVPTGSQRGTDDKSARKPPRSGDSSGVSGRKGSRGSRDGLSGADSKSATTGGSSDGSAAGSSTTGSGSKPVGGYAAALLAKPSPDAAARAEAARAKKAAAAAAAAAAASGDDGDSGSATKPSASPASSTGSGAKDAPERPPAQSPPRGKSAVVAAVVGGSAAQTSGPAGVGMVAAGANTPPRARRGWETPEVAKKRAEAAAARAASATKSEAAAGDTSGGAPPAKPAALAPPSGAAASGGTAAVLAAATAGTDGSWGDDADEAETKAAVSGSATAAGAGGSTWGKKGTFAEVLRKADGSPAAPRSKGASGNFRDFGVRPDARGGRAFDDREREGEPARGSGFERVDRGEQVRGRADGARSWR